MSPTVQHAASELDARYGRTPANSRRTRLIALTTGAVAFVVLAAWLIWAGLLSPNAEIEAFDTGHTIVDDSLVEVRYQLNVEPGTAVSCAFQAQNSSFSIVGWKIIDVPASDVRVRNLVTEIRTNELAVTGLIYRCWLA